MQTLQQLLYGELIGSTKIQLSCGLSDFPRELFKLVDTLEFLDLSGNNLSELPVDFGDFKKLKILFISNNQFKVFPKILANCPSLTMIGFRSNQMEEIPEDSFPLNLQWLILTDNKIEKLPKSIGRCKFLQKFGIAGNKLSSIPDEMKNCRNLELLRISANRIEKIPSWIFSLPRLSWLAYSGNPCSMIPNRSVQIKSVSWTDLEVMNQLGEGASGIISKAILKSKESKEVAIKIFKGEVTSDGLPEDELAICIEAEFHSNLVTLIAEIDGHSEFKKGIVMELIPTNYKNLGNPPNFETCTRDVFQSSQILSIEYVRNILKCIASVACHLHSKGIIHGDLYAHNTMVNSEGNALLGDFGAATFYDLKSEYADQIERIEVRAFGCMIEDLLGQIADEDLESDTYTLLYSLKNNCFNEIVNERISFKEIVSLIS
jgi:tRNA A-37 threonylcarbamoyl transferase component Bud32